LKIALTSLATLAILPLPFLDVVSLNGPSFIPLFLELPFHLRLFYWVAFDATLLFPSYGQPSLSDSCNVNSLMYLEKVVDLSDLPNTKSNINLLPCAPLQMLKKSYDRT
jgi:hypothetical protein